MMKIIGIKESEQESDMGVIKVDRKREIKLNMEADFDKGNISNYENKKSSL